MHRHLRRVIRVTRHRGDTVERARFFSEGDLSERAGQDLPLRLKGFILEPHVPIVPPRSYQTLPPPSAPSSPARIDIDDLRGR